MAKASTMDCAAGDGHVAGQADGGREPSRDPRIREFALHQLGSVLSESQKTHALFFAAGRNSGKDQQSTTLFGRASFAAPLRSLAARSAPKLP